MTHGPQKLPASLPRIRSQTKQVLREMSTEQTMWSRINASMTAKDRESFNQWARDLWLIADTNRDLARLAQETHGNYLIGDVAKNLMEVIDAIPILKK